MNIVHAKIAYALLSGLFILRVTECCTRGLQADSVVSPSRTTRYEMVGAFSRALTADEQLGLKDEIRQLAHTSIPLRPNRFVNVQDPYFPTRESVTIPFSVSGQPLSGEELKMMLVPLKKLFHSDMNLGNMRKKRQSIPVDMPPSQENSPSQGPDRSPILEDTKEKAVSNSELLIVNLLQYSAEGSRLAVKTRDCFANDHSVAFP